MPFKDPDKQREYNRKWRKNNPEKTRESHRKWAKNNSGRLYASIGKHKKTTTRGRANALIHAARSSSKKKGFPFFLTINWVEKKIKAGVCEVTGIRFVLSPQPRHPFLPSLDRKDSKLGYTPANTQVVILAYNLAKSVNTHEDVMTMARALVEKEDGNNHCSRRDSGDVHLADRVPDGEGEGCPAGDQCKKRTWYSWKSKRCP